MVRQVSSPVPTKPTSRFHAHPNYLGCSVVIRYAALGVPNFLEEFFGKPNLARRRVLSSRSSSSTQIFKDLIYDAKALFCTQSPDRLGDDLGAPGRCRADSVVVLQTTAFPFRHGCKIGGLDEIRTHVPKGPSCEGYHPLPSPSNLAVTGGFEPLYSPVTGEPISQLWYVTKIWRGRRDLNPRSLP
jgi:hypothetical protein